MLLDILAIYGIVAVVLTVLSIVICFIGMHDEDIPKAVTASVFFPVAVLVFLYIGARQWKEELFNG